MHRGSVQLTKGLYAKKCKSSQKKATYLRNNNARYAIRPNATEPTTGKY